jgi:hypothetical protein
MCPAVVIKNEVLANNFRNNNKLELIMISFDYVYDTPDILNDFYGPSVSSYENWNVWSSTGSIADLHILSSEIGSEFWGVEENNIGHNQRSALIGPNMELLNVWEGDSWLAKDVKKDIENYYNTFNKEGNINVAELRLEMQKTMQKYAGVFRSFYFFRYINLTIYVPHVIP